MGAKLTIALIDADEGEISGFACLARAQAEERVSQLRLYARGYEGAEISLIAHSSACSGACPDYLGLQDGCEEIATYPTKEPS